MLKGPKHTRPLLLPGEMGGNTLIYLNHVFLEEKLVLSQA